jgi:hypothetical protein
MRSTLVAILVVLALAISATPALGRDPELDVGTKSIDFGTFTAPESGTTGPAIEITNNSAETVPLTLVFNLAKPKDWAEPYDPFIIEDAITPNGDPCPEIAPGATCLVFVTFQTQLPGTYVAWLWINGTDQVKLRAVAE